MEKVFISVVCHRFNPSICERPAITDANLRPPDDNSEWPLLFATTSPRTISLPPADSFGAGFLFIVFIACLLSARAPVAAEGRLFTAFGEGQRSCGEFIEATEAEEKLKPPTAQPEAVYSREFQSFVDFTDGYLRGANSKDDAQYRRLAEGTDHAGRMVWLENYCRAHPIDAFIKALIDLRQYLADHPH